MECVSRYEVAPFSALINMIKYNYYEKTDIFKTLLAVLCDYNPKDERSKERTTHYIELLLHDHKDLASCLMSFLPSISKVTIKHTDDEKTVSKRPKKSKDRNKEKQETTTTKIDKKDNIEMPDKSTRITVKPLKLIDPSDMQDVVKREITPSAQVTAALYQNQGTPIVTMCAPICTVVPSQNLPKMSSGYLNRSSHQKNNNTFDLETASRNMSAFSKQHVISSVSNTVPSLESFTTEFPSFLLPDFPGTLEYLGNLQSLTGQQRNLYSIPGHQADLQSEPVHRNLEFLSGEHRNLQPVSGKIVNLQSSSGQKGNLQSFSGQLGNLQPISGETEILPSVSEDGDVQSTPGQLGNLQPTSGQQNSLQSVSRQYGNWQSISGHLGNFQSVLGCQGYLPFVPNQQFNSQSMLGQQVGNMSIPEQPGYMNILSEQPRKQHYGTENENLYDIPVHGIQNNVGLRSTYIPSVPFQAVMTNALQASSDTFSVMTNEFSSGFTNTGANVRKTSEKSDSGQIKTNSASNYFGTSRNLASFPYTQQLTFPDGQTQNVYFKGSSVQLSSSREIDSNLNRNVFSNPNPQIQHNRNVGESPSYLRDQSLHSVTQAQLQTNPTSVVRNSDDTVGIHHKTKPKKYTIAPNQVARKKLRLTPANKINDPFGGNLF